MRIRRRRPERQLLLTQRGAAEVHSLEPHRGTGKGDQGDSPHAAFRRGLTTRHRPRTGGTELLQGAGRVLCLLLGMGQRVQRLHARAFQERRIGGDSEAGSTDAPPCPVVVVPGFRGGRDHSLPPCQSCPPRWHCPGRQGPTQSAGSSAWPALRTRLPAPLRLHCRERRARFPSHPSRPLHPRKPRRHPDAPPPSWGSAPGPRWTWPGSSARDPCPRFRRGAQNLGPARPGSKRPPLPKRPTVPRSRPWRAAMNPSRLRGDRARPGPGQRSWLEPRRRLRPGPLGTVPPAARLPARRTETPASPAAPVPPAVRAPPIPEALSAGARGGPAHPRPGRVPSPGPRPS